MIPNVDWLVLNQGLHSPASSIAFTWYQWLPWSGSRHTRHWKRSVTSGPPGFRRCHVTEDQAGDPRDLNWYQTLHCSQSKERAMASASFCLCFSTKLAVLSSTLPQKKALTLPSLTSQPHQVLASDLVPYSDVQQVFLHMLACVTRTSIASSCLCRFPLGFILLWGDGCWE